MYDGRDTYDFKAALAAVGNSSQAFPNRAARQESWEAGRSLDGSKLDPAVARYLARRGAQSDVPTISGKLADDYARSFWSNRRRSEKEAVQLQPPSRDELVRHLEKFGPEGIKELADAQGIDLSAETRKPTAADKRKAHALTLLEEGKSAEDVALTKGVRVQTVRGWQREAEGMPKSVQIVRGRGQKRRSTKRQKVER